MGMGTNKEHNAEQIVNIACQGDAFAVDKKTHEVVSCGSLSCGCCLFYKRCEEQRLEWANSPYQPPVATDDWVNELYSKFLDDPNTVVLWFDNDTICIVLNKEEKVGIVKRDENDKRRNIKEIAIAYAMYCGEEIPKELKHETD